MVSSCKKVNNEKKKSKKKNGESNGNFQKNQDLGMRNKQFVDVFAMIYIMHILIFVIRWDIIFGFGSQNFCFKCLQCFKMDAQ